MASVTRITMHRIAMHKLVVLLLVFLLGNAFVLLPDDTARAGWTDRYLLLTLLRGSLLITTLAAATILLYVLMALSSAQAKAKAAREQGVPYKVSPGRRTLRSLLHLAIVFSFAATLIAIHTFEVGFQYCKGRVSDIYGWPASVTIVIMGLEHAFAASLVWD